MEEYRLKGERGRPQKTREKGGVKKGWGKKGVG